MNGITRALVMAAGLSLPAPSSMAQIGGGGAWAAVQTLTPADDVRLELRDGRVLKGRFCSATDQAVTIGGGGPAERGEVWRVYRKVPRSVRTPAVVGALIGGALGLMGGLMADRPSGGMEKSAAVAGAVAIDAGLGALIGCGVGGRGEYVLIYQGTQEPPVGR